MTRVILLLLAVSTSLLAGCASTLKMPLQAENEHIADTGKTIYLMSVTLQNSCRDHFVPWLDSVQIARDTGSGKAELMTFAMDSKGAHYFDDEKLPPKFLVRFDLENGHYTVHGLGSTARGFPIRATFFTPLRSPLAVDSHQVVYLGAVNADVRERKGGEFRAGPVIPLVDQAVACAATGTFDVAIKDDYQADMPLFQQSFPQLQGVLITKAILPPFDRDTVQKWWEAN